MDTFLFFMSSYFWTLLYYLMAWLLYARNLIQILVQIIQNLWYFRFWIKSSSAYKAGVAENKGNYSSVKSEKQQGFAYKTVVPIKLVDPGQKTGFKFGLEFEACWFLSLLLSQSKMYVLMPLVILIREQWSKNGERKTWFAYLLITEITFSQPCRK